MTDKFYGNGIVDRDSDQEKYMKHNTLIYNLYRALDSVTNYEVYTKLKKQAHDYLQSKNLLDTNEEED